MLYINIKLMIHIVSTIQIFELGWESSVFKREKLYNYTYSNLNFHSFDISKVQNSIFLEYSMAFYFKLEKICSTH